MLNTEAAPNKFNEAQGQILLALARQTIMEKLGLKVNENRIAKLAAELEDDQFNLRRGTFVTLNINGGLRGCIGNLSDSDSVKEGVRKNAINAAFYDPRFPALAKEELEKVKIEISILFELIVLLMRSIPTKIRTRLLDTAEFQLNFSSAYLPK